MAPFSVKKFFHQKQKKIYSIKSIWIFFFCSNIDFVTKFNSKMPWPKCQNWPFSDFHSEDTQKSLSEKYFISNNITFCFLIFEKFSVEKTFCWEFSDQRGQKNRTMVRTFVPKCLLGNEDVLHDICRKSPIYWKYVPDSFRGHPHMMPLKKEGSATCDAPLNFWEFSKAKPWHREGG